VNTPRPQLVKVPTRVTRSSTTRNDYHHAGLPALAAAVPRSDGLVLLSFFVLQRLGVFHFVFAPTVVTLPMELDGA
jgi:hypothetical protein